MLEVSYASGAQGPQVHRGPQGHRGSQGHREAPRAIRDPRGPTGWSLGVVKMTPLSQKNIAFSIKKC